MTVSVKGQEVVACLASCSAITRTVRQEASSTDVPPSNTCSRADVLKVGALREEGANLFQNEGRSARLLAFHTGGPAEASPACPFPRPIPPACGIYNLGSAERGEIR